MKKTVKFVKVPNFLLIIGIHIYFFLYEII